MNELIFALKDEKLVSIDDVEKGVQCGCTCPCCGEKLVAKKGNIKCHHFAHISGSNCAYGYETSLHRLAKEMIEELNYIILPSVEIGRGRYDEILLYPSCKIKIDCVELEKKYNNIRPDILLRSGNKVLAIEIYVSHKVDFEKLKKIQKDNLSMIEIDLRELDKDKDKNNPIVIREILQQILLSENDNRKYWVFNNKKCKFIEKNNLQKEVEYFCGNPFVKNCPKSKYCRGYNFASWSNVNIECKECRWFLEYNKVASKVVCLNTGGCVGEKPNYDKSVSVNFDSDKNLRVLKCPGYFFIKKGLSPLLTDCIRCPNFLSGNKNSIDCLLNQ